MRWKKNEIILENCNITSYTMIVIGVKKEKKMSNTILKIYIWSFKILANIYLSPGPYLTH